MGAYSVPTLHSNGAQSNTGQRKPTLRASEAGTELTTRSGTDAEGRGQGSPVLSLSDAENYNDQRQGDKRKNFFFVSPTSCVEARESHTCQRGLAQECLTSQTVTYTRDEATPFTTQGDH